MKKKKQGSWLVTHNGSYCPEYRIWIGMKVRCFQSKHPSYQRYGARGITVCDRWKDSFANFYADMGKRPSKNHSLDRIDNNGNYTPENCRWATREEQMRNTRHSTLLTYRGQTKTMAEWAEITGLKPATITTRYTKYGWSVEQTLSTPVLRVKNRPDNGKFQKQREN